jgi:hypothetical protein
MDLLIDSYLELKYKQIGIYNIIIWKFRWRNIFFLSLLRRAFLGLCQLMPVNWCVAQFPITFQGIIWEMSNLFNIRRYDYTTHLRCNLRSSADPRIKLNAFVFLVVIYIASSLTDLISCLFHVNFVNSQDDKIWMLYSETPK